MPARLPDRIHPFVQEIVPFSSCESVASILLIGIPGEPTIVASRLRRMVASIVGADLADVLCVGYTNAHYVTNARKSISNSATKGGGSTLFGR